MVMSFISRCYSHIKIAWNSPISIDQISWSWKLKCTAWVWFDQISPQNIGQ